MIDLQLNIISVAVVLFVGGLFASITLISLLRRLREALIQPVKSLSLASNDELVNLIPSPVPVPPPAAALNRLRTQPASVVKLAEPLPEMYRLQPQPAAPEQLILSIEPSDGPTRDERNIQKLIDFLRRDGTKPSGELTELAS